MLHSHTFLFTMFLMLIISGLSLLIEGHDSNKLPEFQKDYLKVTIINWLSRQYSSGAMWKYKTWCQNYHWNGMGSQGISLKKKNV